MAISLIRRPPRAGWIALLCLSTMSSTPLMAAGLLVADGGQGGLLELKEQLVDVTINNGIAVTQVEQTFINTESRVVEALYTFPVPRGASIANFSMWINGKEMVGEVVEKEKAREIYESYKRQNVDPGLLEQVDYKTLEMRIFPIAAGAEQRVRFSYYQELEYDHDQATYTYPLATVSRRDVQQNTQGRLSLNVRVLSEIPIQSVDSPSHGDEFVVASHRPDFLEASFEADGGDLSRDFVLSYQTRRAKTGIDLITSQPQGEDGYFMMTLTAGDELEGETYGMDYVFVVDISGSMANSGKLSMSRNTVDRFLDGLSPEDRFELVAFNVQPTTLFGELQSPDTKTLQQAGDFLYQQTARGGTTLAPAMHLAYRYGQPDRPLNVVILSDGMTEQREIRELLQLIQQRPAHAKVFAIGVGNEVNRPLLSQMAEEAGGLADFISQSDNLERRARAFRRKLMRPAATGVQLAIRGVDAYDIVPATLPNLYHGQPIRVYGRFRGKDSKFDIQVDAEVQGRPLTISESDIHSQGSHAEIERMWAYTQIQELLRRADRNGARESVRGQIVSLGEEYSIATEFTSFLVLENNQEYQRWKIDRRNRDRIKRDREGQESLRGRLNQMKADSLANLGPRPASKPPAKPSFQKFTGQGANQVHNTPEPSGSVMLLWLLLPLLGFRRRRR